LIIGGQRAASRAARHAAAPPRLGQPATPPRAGQRAEHRRPWWVWTVPFGLVLAVLLIRNAFLFSTSLYEDADMGANSILIEQARRFTLLVGNYSREKFNHPGPAFLYVQSWGETLFWSVLHVVPTAWNGQLIALYALNALFAALVVAVGYGWTRSVRGAAAALAVVALFAALHPAAFSSDWMPYVYVPAYFAFLVAIASVAAGRVRDAWIAALTGWFLIHGHACFLLFVPLLSLAALVALAWPRRPGLGEWLRHGFSRRKRVWVPVVVISAVFALPMVLELALHWPGNFGKYFSYSSSSQAGGHGVAQIARYTLWFWWPHGSGFALAVLVILYAVAGAVTWRLATGPVQRFCWALLAFDALSTVLFVAYAAVGIDDLTQYYIGYFYWSAPVILVLVIAAGAVEALAQKGGPSWLGLAAAATAAVAAVAAFALAPQTRTSTDHTDPNNLTTGANTDPSLPAGVAHIATLADGRPIVLRFPHDAWPEVTGFLVQAQRSGVTACVADPYWEFMMTSQFICTPAELENGAAFGLYVPGSVPPGTPVVFRLRRALVTSAAK
jgi:hypothetical protein